MNLNLKKSQLIKQNLAESLRIRLRILQLGIKNSWLNDTAYPWDSVANVLGTIMFTLINILFFEVIYTRFDNIAGYSRNEILIFFFMSQLAYYLNSITYYNVIRIDEYIRKGDFDMLLTKPMPALFYTTFRRISLFHLLRDGLPPLLMFGLFVDFHAVHITLTNLLFALVFIIMGLFLEHALAFLLAVSAVWFGRSRSIVHMSYVISQVITGRLPYEAMGKSLRILLTTVIPVAVTTAISTSVLLGKTPPLPLFWYVLCITVVFAFLRLYVWKLAMRNYTSASS